MKFENAHDEIKDRITREHAEHAARVVTPMILPFLH